MSDAKGGGDWDEKKGSGDRGGDDRGGPSKADDYQLRQDADHLKILSIIWYVLSGLSVFGVCAGLAYLVTGLGVATGPGQDATFGGLFACMGVGIIVLSLAGATLNFFVARNLTRRKGHLFCLIMAGLVCLNIPLGTILGIFTIMVLLRPTVKKDFGVAA